MQDTWYAGRILQGLGLQLRSIRALVSEPCCESVGAVASFYSLFTDSQQPSYHRSPRDDRSSKTCGIVGARCNNRSPLMQASHISVHWIR